MNKTKANTLLYTKWNIQQKWKRIQSQIPFAQLNSPPIQSTVHILCFGLWVSNLIAVLVLNLFCNRLTENDALSVREPNLNLLQSPAIHQ